MGSMIQVKRDGEWRNFIAVIGQNHHLAADDVRIKTGLPTRIVGGEPRPTSDLPNIS